MHKNIEAAKNVIYGILADEKRAAKPVLSSMVSIFRAHQAAWKMRRVQYSDTGSINPEKLAQYKLTDDIFLRRKMVPNAQNHGIVVHIDWSGSMSGMISTVIYQTLTMIWFCETINIPIDVYAFTTRMASYENSSMLLYQSSESASVRRDMQALLYVFAARNAGLHSSGSDDIWFTQEEGTMGSAPKAMVSGLRTLMNSGVKFSWLKPLWELSELYMGGTPLFQTVYDSVETIRVFRMRHRIDQCISLWLTDGGDGSGLRVDGQKVNAGGNFHMIDPATGKTYTADHERPALAAIFEMHRERTGATVICMDINDSPGSSVSRVLGTGDLRKYLSAIGIEGRVSTVHGSITAKKQVQTKRSLIMAPKTKFADTGIAIAVRDEFPNMGCDAYIVTHPGWWGDSFTVESVKKSSARWNDMWDDDEDEEDGTDWSEDDDADDAPEYDIPQRVDLSSTLMEQSAMVSMRKFTSMLMPHIAAGR